MTPSTTTRSPWLKDSAEIVAALDHEALYELTRTFGLNYGPAFRRADKVVKHSKTSATVTLLDEDDKPIKYQIVGQTEADAAKGRISYNSPIGKALIGKKVEEEIEVTVPSGDKFYLVDKIEFV